MVNTPLMYMLTQIDIEFKTKSIENMKNRVTHFVEKQKQQPHAIEDDHYKTWRYNKQYRDVQDHNKFVGFKSFVHKPNYDIGKHFSQRQRKQISYLAQKSKILVDQQLIPHEQRSRSLRSQGPLNPKHTFRQLKPDHQLLQPRMRYTNITDKQRHHEMSRTFDSKFHDVYKSFSLNKSKIGQIKISPSKDLNNSDKNINIDMMSSTYSDHGYNKNIKPSFHFQSSKCNNINNQQQKQDSKSKLGNTLGFSNMSPENSQIQSKLRNKVYFKTAKTMALHGHQTAKQIMFQTQYDRKKDLTNINKNSHHEVYVKRPIL